MRPRHLIALGVTVLLGAALWYLWSGFRSDWLSYGGLARELRGTWLWDLRYALIPAYAVGGLWLAERLAALVGGAGRR